MERKGKFSIILSVAVLLLAGGVGFAFGFDTGRITNDEARIKKELSRVDVSGPINIHEVAKSRTGKIELYVLTDYLLEFQKQAGKLQKCGERLDVMEGKEEEAMTVFELNTIRMVNESSYIKLKQMVGQPQEFLQQRIEEYGSEYSTWIDDWCEVLEVTECRDVLEGRLTEVYNNNLQRLKNK